MNYPDDSRPSLLDTISTLRLCNDLQSEVIANMEHYEAVVSGPAADESRTGRRFGYEAEISYLQGRREALDALIAVVEKYSVASNGGIGGARSRGIGLVRS